jgi:hypothetical protein
VAVSGDVVYIVDQHTVRAYTTQGAHLTDFVVPGDGEGAGGIAVDSGGNVYVGGITGNTATIYKYAPVAPVPTTSSTWGALKTKYR